MRKAGQRLLLSMVLFFLVITKVTAQNNVIVEENIRRIDAAEKNVKIDFCNGDILYKNNFNKLYLKNDLSSLSFINDIFTNDKPINKLLLYKKKIKGVKISIVEKSSGILNNIQIYIGGTYIYASVSFDFIDSIIINKECKLSFVTNGICKNDQSRTLDFNFLKKNVARNIDFLIKIRDRDVISKKNEIDNVNFISKNYPNYSFNLPILNNKSWFNDFLRDQFISSEYNYYSREKADLNFIKLIMEDSIDLIKSLLYSPNYFYAVNAMETIIYLNSINRIVIDDKMKEKIEAIKNSPYKITIQHTPDYFGTVNGYGEIKMTDKAVIQKVKKSLTTKKE
jgi:hypothetical protein